jgi:hypothetical protein
MFSFDFEFKYYIRFYPMFSFDFEVRVKLPSHAEVGLCGWTTGAGTIQGPWLWEQTCPLQRTRLTFQGQGNVGQLKLCGLPDK